MTVTSAQLDFAGTTGIGRRGGHREYTAHWIVKTNNAQDTAYAVLQYFYDQGSLPHPDKATSFSYGNDSDTRAICDSIDPRREADNAKVWRVAVHFTTKVDTKKGEDDNGNPTDDPLEFAIDIDFRYNRIQRPADGMEYIGGYGAQSDQFYRLVQEGQQVAEPNTWLPVMSSAFEVYDPQPLIDDVAEVLSITGNFDGIVDGEQMHDYINVVNSVRYGMYRVNGFSYAADPYQSKVQSIIPRRERANGLLYWRITFEIETRRFRTWRYKIQDRGIMRRYWTNIDLLDDLTTTKTVDDGRNIIPIKDATGSPITTPVLLNGEGKPIGRQNGSPDQAAAVGEFRYYRELPFTDIPLLGQLMT